MSQRVEEVKTEKHPKTQTQRKPFLIRICKASQMKAQKDYKGQGQSGKRTQAA